MSFRVFGTFFSEYLRYLLEFALEARLYINRWDCELFSHSMFVAFGFCCITNFSHISDKMFYAFTMFAQYIFNRSSDTDCHNSIPLWFFMCLLPFLNNLFCTTVEKKLLLFRMKVPRLIFMNENMIHRAYERNSIMFRGRTFILTWFHFYQTYGNDSILSSIFTENSIH